MKQRIWKNRIIYVGSSLLAALFLVSFAGCKNSQKKEKAVVEEVKTKKFTVPAVPMTITDPRDRANYVVGRYWDNFDFTDTALIHLQHITEQAFVDYLTVLHESDYAKVTPAIKGMLAKAETDTTGRMYAHFLGLFEKYLYDPNSPYRNEEYYIPVVEYMVESDATELATRTRAEHRLPVLLRNRPGQQATDFTYTLKNGKTGSLYGIKTNYTILFFYNPDCSTCGEIIQGMKNSAPINALLNAKGLTLLAFYPDEDIEIWRKYYADLPATWINSYDKVQKVNNGKLYDLKAIPTLYLLDKDKKVLLKDVDFTVLENWLYNNIRM